MPTVDRGDFAGSLHHVMNRGVGRRSVFETRRDIRFLLSRLAREVRAKRIELLSYAILTTHFHLLVRSLTGELSESIGRIERTYVRWFNATRRRDGPLFRGRFTSRVVDDEWHARAVLLYIDRNPVEAGLAATPERYPWCSAWQRRRARLPRWLARGAAIGSPERWSAEEQDEACWVVERSIEPRERSSAKGWSVARRESERPASGSGVAAASGGGAVELVAGADPATARWLERTALLADGMKAGRVFAAPTAILRAVAAAPEPPRCPMGGARTRSALRRSAAAALLRGLAGLEWGAIAALLRIGRTLAGESARHHADRVASSPEFAAWSRSIVAALIGERDAMVRV